MKAMGCDLMECLEGIRNPCKLLKRWSGRPDSNRRRPAWEAGILPLNYSRSIVRLKYRRIIWFEATENLASLGIQILPLEVTAFVFNRALRSVPSSLRSWTVRQAGSAAWPLGLT